MAVISSLAHPTPTLSAPDVWGSHGFALRAFSDRDAEVPLQYNQLLGECKAGMCEGIGRVRCGHPACFLLDWGLPRAIINPML